MVKTRLDAALQRADKMRRIRLLPFLPERPIVLSPENKEVQVVTTNLVVTTKLSAHPSQLVLASPSRSTRLG
jgi:hypothetical protein